jgi:hypothetical protein
MIIVLRKILIQNLNFKVNARAFHGHRLEAIGRRIGQVMATVAARVKRARTAQTLVQTLNETSQPVGYAQRTAH